MRIDDATAAKIGAVLSDPDESRRVKTLIRRLVTIINAPSRAGRKPIAESVREQIVSLRRSGASLDTIVAETGCAKSTVSSALKDAGLVRPRKSPTPQVD